MAVQSDMRLCGLHMSYGMLSRALAHMLLHYQMFSCCDSVSFFSILGWLSKAREDRPLFGP